ncbi:MAG: helix-turn-helix domain-containing protein [Gemmatimonadaceae bacterium]
MGAKAFVEAVHVTHLKPAYHAEYDRIFQVPVTFGSDKNAVLLTDDGWMSQKPPFASRPALFVMSAHAESLLQRLESSKSTRGRVESLLIPIPHTSDVAVDVIAGRLGLSRQTLFRKLRAEGVSFEGVVADLRREVAIHCLGPEKASVSKTAYRVGYSEPAAFSRAFKRWTGFSPRTYALRAEASPDQRERR